MEFLEKINCCKPFVVPLDFQFFSRVKRCQVEGVRVITYAVAALPCKRVAYSPSNFLSGFNRIYFYYSPKLIVNDRMAPKNLPTWNLYRKTPETNAAICTFERSPIHGKFVNSDSISNLTNIAVSYPLFLFSQKYYKISKLETTTFSTIEHALENTFWERINFHCYRTESHCDNTVKTNIWGTV